MEHYSAEVAANIKQEEPEHFEIVLPPDRDNTDEEYLEETLDSIKQEAETETEIVKENYLAQNLDVIKQESDPSIDEQREVKNNNKGELGNIKLHLSNCNQKCDGCGFINKSKSSKRCDFCDLKFDCNHCKTNHLVQAHSKDSTWFCSKCDIKTSTKARLQNHYQIHLRKVSCEICYKDFVYNYQLKLHQQQHRHGIHATEQKTIFECEICNRSFATKPYLRDHKVRAHTEIKIHCDVCGKVSKSLPNIRRHMQIHLKFPPKKITIKVPCTMCKKFISKESLNVHMKRSHSSGGKYLACNIGKCHQKFENIKELKYHENIHIGVKSYKCPTCNSPAKTFQDIISHMKRKSH